MRVGGLAESGGPGGIAVQEPRQCGWGTNHDNPQGDCRLAKPNYAFAKRQRELAKKQKKEEKLKRKAEQTEQSPQGEAPGDAGAHEAGTEAAGEDESKGD